MNLRRILLDPDAADKGGASPAPAVDTTIRVDSARYTSLLERLQQYEATHAAAEQKRLADLEAAEQRRLAQIAEKEGIAAALKKQADDFRTKYEAEHSQRVEIENAVLSERRSTVLAQGIVSVGQPLVSDEAASQLTLLLESRFVPAREDGKVVVRDKITGRPAADVLPDILKSPSYSHFFKATQQGGSGATGGDTPPTPEATVRPKSLGAAAIEALKKAQASGAPLPFGFSNGPRFRV